ncbi:hypothetical protein B0H17DRAFT_1334936, partial [Mycena rosella]
MLHASLHSLRANRHSWLVGTPNPNSSARARAHRSCQNDPIQRRHGSGNHCQPLCTLICGCALHGLHLGNPISCSCSGRHARARSPLMRQSSTTTARPTWASAVRRGSRMRVGTLVR